MREVIFTFISHPKLLVEIVLKTKIEDEGVLVVISNTAQHLRFSIEANLIG